MQWVGTSSMKPVLQYVREDLIKARCQKAPDTAALIELAQMVYLIIFKEGWWKRQFDVKVSRWSRPITTEEITIYSYTNTSN